MATDLSKDLKIIELITQLVPARIEESAVVESHATYFSSWDADMHSY